MDVSVFSIASEKTVSDAKLRHENAHKNVEEKMKEYEEAKSSKGKFSLFATARQDYNARVAKALEELKIAKKQESEREREYKIENCKFKIDNADDSQEENHYQIELLNIVMENSPLKAIRVDISWSMFYFHSYQPTIDENYYIYLLSILDDSKCQSVHPDLYKNLSKLYTLILKPKADDDNAIKITDGSINYHHTSNIEKMVFSTDSIRENVALIEGGKEWYKHFELYNRSESDFLYAVKIFEVIADMNSKAQYFNMDDPEAEREINTDAFYENGVIKESGVGKYDKGDNAKKYIYPLIEHWSKKYGRKTN